MKHLVAKCVQAYNEAEKRKALGCPGIDPKMAAKQKKPAVDQADASRREEPRIVFPASMTGVKPKVSRKQGQLKPKPESARPRTPLMMLHPPRSVKPRRKIGLLPQSPLSSSQFLLLVLHLHNKNVV